MPTADELLRGTSRAGQDCDRADRPAEGPQALYVEAARHEIGEENRQSGQSKREGELVAETVEKPAGRANRPARGVGPDTG